MRKICKPWSEMIDLESQIWNRRNIWQHTPNYYLQARTVGYNSLIAYYFIEKKMHTDIQYIYKIKHTFIYFQIYKYIMINWQ